MSNCMKGYDNSFNIEINKKNIVSESANIFLKTIQVVVEMSKYK